MGLPTDTKTLIGMGKNIIKIKQSIPKTSTAQTAILNSVTEGIYIHCLRKNLLYRLGLNITSCARLFNLDPSTLFRAQKKEERVITNMTLPPVPRDQGEPHYPLLVKFFDTIPPKSGKLLNIFNSSLLSNNLGRMNQHVFRGTEPEFYTKYKEFCIKNNATKKQIIQTPRILQRERRAFHIGIEKGYKEFTCLFISSESYN